MAGYPRVFIAIVVFWSVAHFQDAAILKDDRPLAHAHPELFSEVTTGETHGLNRENEAKESRLKRQAGVDGELTQIQEKLTSLREGHNSLQSHVDALLTRMDDREKADDEQSRVLNNLRNDITVLQGSQCASNDDCKRLERKLETLVGLTLCKAYNSHYNFSCYHIVNETLTWSAAKENCRELGGKLAEIENSDENDYIKKIAQLGTENVWLGGTDLSTEGNWVWASSNKVMEFTNWETGQPDNYLMEEDCLEIQKQNNYKWNDAYCQFKRMSVCEISRESL